jgi:putative endonuclease
VPKLMSTKSGDLGEEIARELLQKKGYKILSTKFKCKFGEIDIVAKDRDILVFVEVKTRWSRKFGKPEEAVTPHKLAKIKRVSEYFCMMNNLFDAKQRIEVVALEIEKGKIISSKIILVD